MGKTSRTTSMCFLKLCLYRQELFRALIGRITRKNVPRRKDFTKPINCFPVSSITAIEAFKIFWNTLLAKNVPLYIYKQNSYYFYIRDKKMCFIKVKLITHFNCVHLRREFLRFFPSRVGFVFAIIFAVKGNLKIIYLPGANI